MQVVIFGATGSLGRHIVQFALSKGYAVKAFTRNPQRLSGVDSPLLTIEQGDVLKPDEVLKAVQGADAVLCALGDGAKGKIRAIGTQKIIEAMQTQGIKRLVCQTTLGLGDSWHNLNFFWKYIMFGFLLRKAFKDHEAQEKNLRDSHLSFTIVRPSAFTNQPATHSFKVGFGSLTKGLKLSIPRADVAQFMVDQLRSEAYIRKSVSISN